MTIQPEVVDSLNLDSIPAGTTARFRLCVSPNALGDHWKLPLIVVKGRYPGPTLGVTAAIHGNELNGVSVIHRVVARLKRIKHMAGTLIAAPVVNVPGFLNVQREFADGADLNRVMPGKETGTEAEQYAYHLTHRLLPHFNYMLDLHTASFGRVNTLYVRADLSNPQIKRLAELQSPDIIVNVKPGKGTFRYAATSLGITALTIEVGNPAVLQAGKIKSTMQGIMRALGYLKMIPESTELAPEDNDYVVCSQSYWLYAEHGGILEVFPALGDRVQSGEEIGQVTNLFGDRIVSILAPHEAVVVAKATNPVCNPGSRVVHLGRPQ